MDWLGLLGLVIALLTAAGSIWYNHRRSRVAVRQQDFGELAETVRVLGEDLERTRSELRATKAELKIAEERIDELEGANRRLKARVAELEAENKELHGRLKASAAD